MYDPVRTCWRGNLKPYLVTVTVVTTRSAQMVQAIAEEGGHLLTSAAQLLDRM